MREKANFPDLKRSDGNIERPGFSRYFIQVKDSKEEALLDGEHLRRHRNAFTKSNIRTFLKHCIQKEAWIGAPWLVKEHLAHMYRLPMVIPLHLSQEARSAHLRISQAQRDFAAGKRKKRKSDMPRPFSLDVLEQESEIKLDENGSPEAPKYPVEDLDLDPLTTNAKRPPLKFLSPLDGSPNEKSGLCMHSVGSLLEIWSTLISHWDVYQLDLFSFDDLLDALTIDTDKIKCELLDEIHCGILRVLVNTNGVVEVPLPKEHKEDDEDESIISSVPETPIESNRDILQDRSLMSAVINDQIKNKSHRATEMLESHGWVERLQKRGFSDGGWQMMMVGVLLTLSADPLLRLRCEAILTHLAPLDMPPTQATVRTRYATLDVNQRVSALQLLIVLSISSTSFRTHLEHRLEEMTAIRKTKVEVQRTRKELLKGIEQLKIDRAECYPEDEVANKDTNGIKATTHGKVHDRLDESEQDDDNSDEDEEEEEDHMIRRSKLSRKRKRYEELAQRESERVAKMLAIKESNDKVKKYKKICRDIDQARRKVDDCENKVEDFDGRLREMHVNRIRLMGRDRFFGRWWWFERLGMPFDGTRPKKNTRRDRSIKDAYSSGYANGRLWIQGPTEQERRGFIHLNAEDEKLYAARHGTTVVMRKDAEEGECSVSTAEEWGYYDTPEELDSFIDWLDDRGRREKDLRKELMNWRDVIVQQMDVMRAHLYTPQDPTAEADEEKSHVKEAPKTRVATRNKAYLDTEDVDKNWPCLKWFNTAVPKTGRHCIPSPNTSSSSVVESIPKDHRKDQAKPVAVPQLPVTKKVGRPNNISRTKTVINDSDEEPEEENIEIGRGGRPIRKASRAVSGTVKAYANGDIEGDIEDEKVDRKVATRRSTRLSGAH